MGVGVATFEGVALFPFRFPFLLLQHNQNVDIFSSMCTCKKCRFEIITKTFPIYRYSFMYIRRICFHLKPRPFALFFLLSDAPLHRTTVRWKFRPYSFNFPTNHSTARYLTISADNGNMGCCVFKGGIQN